MGRPEGACVHVSCPLSSPGPFPSERPVASSFRVVEHSWHPLGTKPRPSELVFLGVVRVSVDNRTLERLISKTQLSELTSPCKPRTEPTTLKFHPLLLATRGLFEMFVGQNPIMLKMAPSSGPQALGWPTLLGATLKAMAGSAAVCGQWPSEAACRPRGEAAGLPHPS